MRLLAEDLLLLGGGLLGGLLCLLGCGLLGGLWLGRLLCRLLGLLGSGLLGSLRLPCLGLLGGQLEASCSLLASSSGSHHLLGGNHLVVGNDVLEDGLAGGSLLVLQSLDGSSD